MIQRLLASVFRNHSGLVVTLIAVQVLLLGSFLITPGLPKGPEIVTNLINGYQADDDSWHLLWDDSRYPGQPKNVSRFAVSNLGLTWLIQLTGDLFLADRIAVWFLLSSFTVGVYLFVRRLSGSAVAATLAGLLAILSRGAMSRAILPMMAGFALIPFVILATDRFLEQPSLRRSMVLAIVLALFATAAIPAMTYMMGMALFVYVSAYTIRTGWLARNSESHRRQLLRVAKMGALTGAATVGMSFYFIAGLSLATLPVLQDSGEYTVETVESLSTDPEAALLFFRDSFRFNSGVMDVAIWLLVISALLVPLVKFNWRVIALVLIALGGVFFASNVTSPLYDLLFDRLPFFSEVRGARRWTAWTLFGFVVLVGIGIAAMLKKSRLGTRFRWSESGLSQRAAAVAAGLLVLMVLLNVVTQISALNRWFEPFDPDDALIAPYVWLRDTPEQTVFATTPFLATRIQGESFFRSLDFGKTLGPGISGRTAYGVFRTGGLDVNDALFDIVSPLERQPARFYEHFTLDSGQINLSRQKGFSNKLARDFILMAALTIDDIEANSARFSVRFRRAGVDENERYYQFNFRPSTGGLAFSAVKDGENRLISSQAIEPIGTGRYDLNLSMIGDQFAISINGVQVLSAKDSAINANGEVLIISNDLSGNVKNVVFDNSGIDPAVDYSLARLLGLFNVGYLVLQPYTGGFERQIIDRMPGLKELKRWDGSAIYENQYHLDGPAYVPGSYGIFSGDPASTTHSLYQLDAVAINKPALFLVSDLPDDSAAEIAKNAAFFVINLTDDLNIDQIEQLEELRDQSGSRPAPLFYSWDLTRDSRAFRAPENVSAFTVTDGSSRQMGRGKNFVLELNIDFEEKLPAAVTKVQFRVRGTRNFYEIAVDTGLETATLIEVTSGGEAIIATGDLPPIIGNTRLRVSAVDNRFRLFIDDVPLIDASITRINRGGPILLLAEGSDVVYGSLRLISGDSALRGLDGIAEQGFTSDQIIAAHDRLGVAVNAVLGLADVFSAEFSPKQDATYRIVVVADGLRPPVIQMGVESDDLESGVNLNAGGAVEGESANEVVTQWIAVSDDVSLGESRVRLSLTNSEFDSRVTGIYLIETEAGSDSAPGVAALLEPPAPIPVDLERHSATNYSGALDAPGSGPIVFREAFNDGWSMKIDGQSIQRVRAFGSLNAYFPNPEMLTDGRLVGATTLKFTPQSRYRTAQFVSLFVFLGVLGALVGPAAWQRFAAGTRFGRYVSQRAIGVTQGGFLAKRPGSQIRNLPTPGPDPETRID